MESILTTIGHTLFYSYMFLGVLVLTLILWAHRREFRLSRPKSFSLPELVDWAGSIIIIIAMTPLYIIVGVSLWPLLVEKGVPPFDKI